MLSVENTKVVAIGEAMIEMATVGEGLYRRGFAGDTYNTAWHISQALGPTSNVGFVTRVGQDRLSDSFVAEVANDGMDVSGISRDANRIMGLYLIELNGVERSFDYWRKDSAAVGFADDASVLASALKDTGLIHLSGITLAILCPKARGTLIGALATARQNGATVSFDPNIRPKLWTSLAEIRETITRVLDVSDIALPSFDDEANHWGDATPAITVERFVRSGVREVVVKNGDGPITSYSDGQILETETPVVTGIRDTTGAGDAFNAGYLSARLGGYDPNAAVSYGQRMSGEIIRHFGAKIPKSAIRPIAVG